MSTNKVKSVYVSALGIGKFHPFREKQTATFIHVDEGVKPIQWTIIIGNNNTGKTRLLKGIANTLSHRNTTKDNIRTAFNYWITESVKTYIKNNDINIEDLKDEIPHSVVEDINETIVKKFPSLDSFVVITIYKENVSNSISQGQYKPVDVTIEDGDIDVTSTDELIINIDEEKFLGCVPKGGHPFVIGYGVSRWIKNNSNTFSNSPDSTANLIDNANNLIDVEDWLIQTDYAIKNNLSDAVAVMAKIRALLTSGILPDIDDFRFTSKKDEQGIKSFVEFRTPYGWTQMGQLGYGYKASIGWIVDLAKKMFDQYAEYEEPLNMPAIVLIDEIDLHLHPSWQRRITSHLSSFFPNVQFIATTHNPLIIQSLSKLNLLLLKREGNSVVISQPEIRNYKGWSVEEIMSELMGLEDNTFSDTYLRLMAEFEEALDDENFEDANAIYEKLDNILPPDSGQRKILKIQMATLPR